MKQYHVVLETECVCAKKHHINQIHSFDTKAEAQEYAFEWAERLNTDFCGKHGFESVTVDDNFVISVESGGFMEPCEI